MFLSLRDYTGGNLKKMCYMFRIDHSIAQADNHIDLARSNVCFGVPYRPMRLHKYFGYAESYGKDLTGGDFRKVSLQDQV